MANVEVYRVEFGSPQAAGVGFPITVVVENHENIAPLAGSHKCKTSGVAGHKVDVTLTVETDGGQTELVEEKTVCAPVQSLWQGNARARFDVSLPAGTYFVRAEVDAVNVDGHDSSEPYRLEVDEDSSTIDEGGLTSGSEETAGTGFGDVGTVGSGGGELPFPTGGSGGLASNPWVLGAVALLVLIVLRPYANLGAALAD